MDTLLYSFSNKMVSLPKKVVEEIKGMKEYSKPKVYHYVCTLILELDEICLLNDQITFATGLDETGGICIEWPNYGLYFDVSASDGPGTIFRIHHQNTKTLARLTNYNTAKILLVSLLEQLLNKNDIYDAYKKEKRTMENSMMCNRYTPF